MFFIKEIEIKNCDMLRSHNRIKMIFVSALHRTLFAVNFVYAYIHAKLLFVFV